MTGDELREARHKISEAIGHRLSYADMAELCGLSDPTGNGKDTIRKWESGEGPSGPVATFLWFLTDGLVYCSDDVFLHFHKYARGRLGLK